MRPLRTFLILGGALALSGTLLAAGPQVGGAAPGFTLTTVDGKTFSLADAARAHKAVVVMFIAAKCPYSNAYNDRMRDMSAAYEEQGVLFAGSNSNKSEPAEEVIDHEKKHGFAFPLLTAPDNKVADLYEARHTPEIFVVDPD